MSFVFLIQTAKQQKVSFYSQKKLFFLRTNYRIFFAADF